MPRSGPRPHARRYPDPIDNKLYVDCMRARAQAWYLEEQWFITEDEYIALWRQKDRYLNKGRHNHNFCMIRKDYSKPWQLGNVEIVTRLEHYNICSRDKTGKFAQRKQRRLARKQNV